MESKKYELGKEIIKAVDSIMGTHLNSKCGIIKKMDIFLNNESEEPNQINIEYEVY